MKPYNDLKSFLEYSIKSFKYRKSDSTVHEAVYDIISNLQNEDDSINMHELRGLEANFINYPQIYWSDTEVDLENNHGTDADVAKHLVLFFREFNNIERELES